MTFYPKTLSKQVRDELCPFTRVSDEGVLEKLKRKPKLLLAFFEQASMARDFVRKNPSLFEKTFNQINLFIFSEIISFDEGLKAIKLFLRFNPIHRDFLPKDLAINDNSTIYTAFSRMVVLLACEKLRGMNNEKIAAYSLSSFASHLLDIEEFECLYRTFFLPDFTYYHLVSNQALVRLAKQSKIWGFERGYAEFQSILCKRLFHASDSFIYYGIAKAFGLSMVEERCTQNLDRFKYSYINEGEDEFYSSTRFILDNDVFKDLRPRDRLRFAEGYYNDKFDPRLDCPGQLERLELTFDRLGTVSVKRFLTRDPITVLNVRNSLLKHEKKTIDRSKVKSIIFDARFDSSLESKMGMIGYFYNIEEVSFFFYEGFEPYWFNKFLKAVPRLNLLRIKESSEVSKNNLFSISIYLKDLNKLILSDVNLSSDCFARLLSIPLLSHLAIQNSSFELEGVEQKLFEKLAYLDLSGSKGSSNHLKTLLKACINVHTLIMEKVENFSLQHIAYPDKLIELGLDCDQIDKFFIEGNSNDIDRFFRLKVIYISGKPTKALNQFLALLPEGIKVKFKNVK